VGGSIKMHDDRTVIMIGIKLDTLSSKSSAQAETTGITADTALRLG